MTTLQFIGLVLFGGLFLWSTLRAIGAAMDPPSEDRTNALICYMLGMMITGTLFGALLDKVLP